MALQIRKAERKQAKARVAFIGPSGTGKTYSSILFARGLAGPNGKILLVDTEHHSGELYSNLTDYDYAEIEPPYETEKYIEAIRVAEENGYDVLILDSISHAWAGQGGLLEQQDAIANRSANKFSAWGEITPKHQAFVEAILGAGCHIIATMRSKTAYALIPDASGKTKPEKLGLAPVQRDGIDYEFSLVLDIDRSHTAQASKDRTGLFDARIFVPSEAHGAELKAWLEGGATTAQVQKPALTPTPTPTKAPEKKPERTSPKNKYTQPEVERIKQNTYIPNGWSTAVFDKSIEEGGAYFEDGIWDRDRIDNDFKMRMAAKKVAAPKQAEAVVVKPTFTCDTCGKSLSDEEYALALKADIDGMYCPQCLAKAIREQVRKQKCQTCGKTLLPEEAEKALRMSGSLTCAECRLMQKSEELRAQRE